MRSNGLCKQSRRSSWTSQYLVAFCLAYSIFIIGSARLAAMTKYEKLSANNFSKRHSAMTLALCFTLITLSAYCVHFSLFGKVSAQHSNAKLFWVTSTGVFAFGLGLKNLLSPFGGRISLPQKRITFSLQQYDTIATCTELNSVYMGAFCSMGNVEAKC